MRIGMGFSTGGDERASDSDYSLAGTSMNGTTGDPPSRNRRAGRVAVRALGLCLGRIFVVLPPSLE